MCFGPLGKFKSYFSIVSPLRGQYITVNESCHFYYQWSTAGQIKTRLHILPPRPPSLAKQPGLISPPSLPFPPNLIPLFLWIPPFPVLLFILVCLLCCGSARIESDTAASPPPPLHQTRLPLFSPVAPSALRRVCRRPYNERGTTDTEKATKRPWGPPPHGSQPLQLQDQPQ